MGRWEWIAKRLLILAAYGFNMDYFHDYVSYEDFLTVEWLEKYYNEPIPDYVKTELDAIKMVTASRPTWRRDD